MPKFNPIFTFSKIDLKLTKKSSYFIFSNFFKKILEFYIVSSYLKTYCLFKSLFFNENHTSLSDCIVIEST